MKNTNKIHLDEVTTSELEERKAQILSSLPPTDHLIHGSLITSLVKCGKPNCRCSKGEGHKSLRLSSYYHGKTSVDHVPVSWETWVQKGIENYQSTQELILELSEIYRALFKRRGKG
jgi:hypothetical protein